MKWIVAAEEKHREGFAREPGCCWAMCDGRGLRPPRSTGTQVGDDEQRQHVCPRASRADPLPLSGELPGLGSAPGARRPSPACASGGCAENVPPRRDAPTLFCGAEVQVLNRSTRG